MKKIFVNDHALFLSDRDGLKVLQRQYRNTKQPLQVLDFENTQQLKRLLGQLESEPGAHDVALCSHQLRQLEKDFFSLFIIMEAAGCVVHSNQNRVLMMFRRGKWDLPKGKRDEGETMRQTAGRETMEETGIATVKLGKRIVFFDGRQKLTYHTYRLHGEAVLKATAWYHATGNEAGALIPQAIEQITEAGWYTPDQILQQLKNSYRSVAWVLQAAGVV